MLRAGAVAGDEDLVGYAAHIGLVTASILSSWRNSSRQSPKRVWYSASWWARPSLSARPRNRSARARVLKRASSSSVTSVVLQPVELLVDRRAHLFGRVAGQGNGVDGEEAGVFFAGEAAEALGFGGDRWSRTRLR